MDKFFRNQLSKWIFTKLKGNPNKFGADDCNALFMQTYLAETYGVSLPLSAMKAISTVSRTKSELLVENPQYDKRVKHKSKKKKKFLSDDEEKSKS